MSNFEEVAGHNGGTHVGGILTTEAAAELAEGLLTSEVDERVMKVRPMATPVDQLSRSAANRRAGSMKVEYYAVDTRAAETVVSEAHDSVTATSTGNAEVTLTVEDGSVFDASDTLMILDETVDSGKEHPIFYVKERNGDDLKIVIVNGIINQYGYMSSPAIKAGSRVIRMGRAAGELDVQTPQFEALPHKQTQFCQIFKAQIEQSTLMRACNKEVGWNFSDQEEIAVYDMRLGMERSFLFGHKARITDSMKKSEVFLTGGIWNQAGREVKYAASGATGNQVSSEEWLKVMKAAFTGHGSSAKKVLIAGSNLIERLSLMDGGQQRVMLANDTVTRWGLDFHEIHSKFGTLYVVMSEVMDSAGHADDGLIIDTQYLTKYVHIPFNAATLDLRTSGQRNTDAVVMTEASCLVLRHPEAHLRVVKS